MYNLRILVLIPLLLALTACSSKKLVLSGYNSDTGGDSSSSYVLPGDIASLERDYSSVKIYEEAQKGVQIVEERSFDTTRSEEVLASIASAGGAIAAARFADVMGNINCYFGGECVFPPIEDDPAKAALNDGRKFFAHMVQSVCGISADDRLLIEIGLDKYDLLVGGVATLRDTGVAQEDANMLSALTSGLRINSGMDDAAGLAVMSGINDSFELRLCKTIAAVSELGSMSAQCDNDANITVVCSRLLYSLSQEDVDQEQQEVLNLLQ